jgi:hypothetical protein
MPTSTYVSLATITLSSTDNEIIFSSIPATYRDLVLVGTMVTSAQPQAVRLRFNGDAGSNYPFVEAYGTGSSAVSGAATSVGAPTSFYTSLSGTNFICNIMDYSATDKHTNVLSRGNDSAFRVAMTAARWANTAAVNQVSIVSTNTSFNAGSTFSLYGIAA